MKQNRNRKDGTPARTGTSPAKARKDAWKDLIVTLYLQGNSMREVVRLAEVETGGHRFSKDTVCKYVNEAIDNWREHKTQLIDNHKAIELAKINTLEATYWSAWARSCEPIKTKVKTKKKAEEAGRMVLAQVRDDEKPGNGDPQFLRGVQWCIEQRCKILGIEVPQGPQPQQVTNNTQINNTTVIRRVIFKTRETTATPQVIQNSND